MTDWVQHHPTVPRTTPDGRTVDIDVEIAPLVDQLWRLGYTTKVACQDVGEAIINGGTRAAPADRQRAAAPHTNRAWIIVGIDQGAKLLDTVHRGKIGGEWRSHRVSKDADPNAWVSITFPRQDIGPAAAWLRSIP